MPPKKRTKAKQQQYDKTLGHLTATNKEFEQKAAELKMKLDELDLKKKAVIDTNAELSKLNQILIVKRYELSHVKTCIDDKNTELQNSSTVLKRKRSQLENTNSSNNEMDESVSKAVGSLAFTFSKRKSTNRRKKPTVIELSKDVRQRRITEFRKAGKHIHGATKNNLKPLLVGVTDILSSTFKMSSVSEQLLKNNKIKSHMTKALIPVWVKEYEQSSENEHRSLNVYYSHNVMGKAKYRSLCTANRNTSFNKYKAPNYLPYAKLATLINNIEIGELHDISPSLTYNLDDDEIKDGCYRNIAEYAIRFATFYLNANERRVDKLKCFDSIQKKKNDSFIFAMAFGGDGAPGSGLSFLLSFLNVGKRIMSSAENYLVFGANVDECSVVARRFVAMAIKDISYLESQVFEIDLGKERILVEFFLGELPNDMKMVAMLGGELPNSAHYFLSFADVNKDNASQINRTFGSTENNDWKPWDYSKRVSDAIKVADEKARIAKDNGSIQSQRTRILKYLKEKLKSRQEFHPLVGGYIDRAKSEPLDLKNNCTKEMFYKLFKMAYSQSQLGNIKSFQQIPTNSLFYHFLDFVRVSMDSKMMYNKAKKWFNEIDGKRTEGNFNFRFKGKESKAYLKKFPWLVALLLNHLKSDAERRKIIEVHDQSILLRKMLSFAVRLDNFNLDVHEEMKTVGRELFATCALVDASITPSMWALSMCSPVHAGNTYTNYGLGLGCNSMEGREQKHQRIAKYSENTVFHSRWRQIFRHEYIHLIYLRENGFDQQNYIRKREKYIPDEKLYSCKKCGYTLNGSKCDLCDSNLMLAFLQQKQRVLQKY